MDMSSAIAFNKANVYTAKSPKGYGFTYFALRNFKKSEIVFICRGKIIGHQTSKRSVQINWGKHFLPSKWTGAYLNHSCKPNLYIHTQKDGFPVLMALNDIRADEELTYSYWMTEFEWSKNADENTVKCMCGERSCRGHVLSFSQLSEKEKNQLLLSTNASAYLRSYRFNAQEANP